MTQTPMHVSLLQKFFKYFELVASVGMVLPEPHVRAVSTLLEELSEEVLHWNDPTKSEPANPVIETAPVHSDGPVGIPPTA
jgi:hypothetical protein